MINAILKLSIVSAVVLSGTGVLAQTTDPAQIGEKSAAYIESLKMAGKPADSKADEKSAKKGLAQDDKKVAVTTKEPDAKVPSDAKTEKKPDITVAKKPVKKPAPLVAAKAEPKDSAEYVRKQQVPVEPVYAVYPELSAIYSKGGVYYVVLKLGNKTITAQDGEQTICGVVKVLNLNSAKVGSQVLYVN